MQSGQLSLGVPARTSEPQVPQQVAGAFSPAAVGHWLALLGRGPVSWPETHLGEKMWVLAMGLGPVGRWVLSGVIAGSQAEELG